MRIPSFVVAGVFGATLVAFAGASAAPAPQSERIELPGGVPAHVAWPASRRPAPAIVLAHDGLGLRASVRDLALRLARQGYVVLVPDRTNGGGPGDDPLVRQPRPADAVERELRTLETAIAWLRAHARVGRERIGAIGFAEGGVLAFDLAARRADLSAVVVFDAVPSGDAAALAASRVPLQVHLGVFDEEAGAGAAATLRSQWAGRGGVTEVHAYGGAGRGFLDESRPSVFHADASRQAWARLLTFLQRHLRGDA